MSFTNSKIEGVYVINLDKDKERLASFDSQMKKQNITYTRFPAILGSKVHNSEYLTEFCNTYCTDGMKGCALSHRSIWEEAYKKQYKYVMIFEDDAILSDNFDTKLKEMWSHVPDNFDIVYPGCRARCDPILVQQALNMVTGVEIKRINEHVYSFGGDFTGHCYILSRKCIEKIYNRILSTPIDVNIQIYIKELNLNAYYLKPVIVTVDDVNNDSNLSDQYPSLLTYLLDYIKLGSSVPLGYLCASNVLKIGGMNINLYIVFFVILLSFIPFFLFKWVFAWLFIEFIVSQDMKNTLRYLIFMSIPVAVRLRFAYETMPVKKIIKLL